MLNSESIIRHCALVLGSLCLLGCLPLCLLTPEGALFLFVTGCSWLMLSQLADKKETTTPEQRDSADLLSSSPS